MTKYKETIKLCYLIQLSNKQSIQIDQDELSIVLKGIQKGYPVKVKQGIFNPSFFICIVEDIKRTITVLESNRNNKFRIKEGLAKPMELKPLTDIFKENKLLGNKNG